MPEDGVLDPAAVAEIAAIRNTPSHDYHNPNARGFAEAKAHMRTLYLRGYGGAEILDGVIQTGREEAPASTPRAASPDALVQEAVTDAPSDKPFAERVPGPDSPSPDPGVLSAVWDNAGVREVTTAAGDLGVAAEEVSSVLRYAAEQSSQPLPDPEQTLATLRQEWGETFDEKLEAAYAAVERMPDTFKTFLNQTGLGDDRKVIRRLAELGAPLIEVRAKLDAIVHDTKHPYNLPNDAGHEAARREVRRLYVKLYSDRPVE